MGPHEARVRARRGRLSWPNRCDSRWLTGDHARGHSLSPSAIRVACQSSSVLTIVAIRARMRSASRRWLPSKRRGRCTLRIHSAASTPASTSTEKTSTSSANQPWCPSHGSVACLSTTPISAIRIVGARTRKPQKMNACISPGPRRCSSLRCPRTIVASLRTRRANISGASHRLAAPRTSPTSRCTRRANSVPLTARQPPDERGGGRATEAIRPHLADLGGDRGHHLVQIADHGVVGAREDRSLAVGVDRQQPLGALASGHVLGGAADPAGDVDLRRDLRPRLADLVGVGAPAGARHRARAADRAAEQRRELLDHREALGRADPATAGDDDVGVGQRDPAGGRRRRARRRDASGRLARPG